MLLQKAKIYAADSKGSDATENKGSDISAES